MGDSKMSDDEFFAAFDEWKSKVNRIVLDEIFIELDDLPDWDFMSAFEGEVTPEEAADEILRLNIPAFDSL
jgi:hypothetical protein